MESKNRNWIDPAFRLDSNGMLLGLLRQDGPVAASNPVELTGGPLPVMERTFVTMTACDEPDPRAEANLAAVVPLGHRDRSPGAHPSIAVPTNDTP